MDKVIGVLVSATLCALLNGEAHEKPVKQEIKKEVKHLEVSDELEGKTHVVDEK